MKRYIPDLMSITVDGLPVGPVEPPNPAPSVPRTIPSPELAGPWKKAGWPTCDVCNKPVERMETARDVTKQTEILIAHCHGDSEVVELPRTMLEDADGLDLRMGRAFVRKALPEPDPKKLTP